MPITLAIGVGIPDVHPQTLTTTTQVEVVSDALVLVVDDAANVVIR